MKTLREQSIFETFPLPSEFESIVNEMEDRIVSVVEALGYNNGDVDICDCKEKYGMLRCYVSITSLITGELSDEEVEKYYLLESIVATIVSHYEKKSKGLIKT